MTTTAPNTVAPETVPFMWDPEDQLIGALLHTRWQPASDIIEMVPATAIQHPVARWAYELITTIVTDHHTDPDPTLVLTLARSQPPAADADIIAELTTTAIRPNVLGDLGNYLANAYTNTHNINQVREYARLVLDDAFRRAAGTWGARLQALADSHADREDITTAITEIMRGELRDLWSRAERAAKPAPRTEEPTTMTKPTTWQWPLTPEQYKALIDCKYQPHTRGWALLDNHQVVRAWHWIIPGDTQWSSADTALRAFLPDTRIRNWRTRTGWSVRADDGELLDRFLSQAKPLDPGGDDDHVRH
ncbi:hypothetical protein EB74_08630 [Mycobacterium sp. SWH-M5]|nr:hypothetical protein EB74_08630 [Mycobacterium sp. SWH-M5]